MPKMIDMTGRSYGRWTVIEFAGTGGTDRGGFWKCICSCGTISIVKGASLRREGGGGSRSCGCLSREITGARSTTHGESGRRKTTEYRSWAHLIQRCINPNDKKYPDYGGRGITVCERWLGVTGFANFLTDMGRKPTLQHSIDRRDNDGPYSKENCRWATLVEQARNKRTNRMITYNGETMSLVEWSERIGISQYALINRLENEKWTLEQALTEPIMARVSIKNRRQTTGEAI